MDDPNARRVAKILDRRAMHFDAARNESSTTARTVVQLDSSSPPIF